MFCSNCGNEVGSEDGYCLNCGKKLNDSQNSVIRDIPTSKKKREGKRRLLPVVLVCAVALVLAGAVLSFVVGEMSKGSLEGHTSASVMWDGVNMTSGGIDIGIELNAENGSFSLEVDSSGFGRWAGASFSKLWFEGSYDYAKTGNQESYTWTVDSVKCDGAVPQSVLDEFRDGLNSNDFHLTYEGAFPCGEWKLSCICFYPFEFALGASEIGTGDTAACGDLGLTVSSDNIGSVSMGGGSWWMNDSVNGFSFAMPGMASRSYGFSFDLPYDRFTGTIYR